MDAGYPDISDEEHASILAEEIAKSPPEIIEHEQMIRDLALQRPSGFRYFEERRPTIPSASIDDVA